MPTFGNVIHLGQRRFTSSQTRWMPSFWQVYLDVFAVEKEKTRLDKENGQLRGILKQVLDGVSVNDEVLNQANPLLVVNGKVAARGSAGACSMLRSFLGTGWEWRRGQRQVRCAGAACGLLSGAMGVVGVLVRVLGCSELALRSSAPGETQARFQKLSTESGSGCLGSVGDWATRPGPIRMKVQTQGRSLRPR